MSCSVKKIQRALLSWKKKSTENQSFGSMFPKDLGPFVINKKFNFYIQFFDFFTSKELET